MYYLWSVEESWSRTVTETYTDSEGKTQTRTREEALEWTRRFPNPSLDGGAAEIEVRQMFELEDFEPSAATEKLRELGVGGGR